MRETAARITRKFNPGLLQADREVIDQFVVRHHELRVVLEVLRANINAASCQHALVVAPRGRGKTMLLARVAAELRTDEDLSQVLLPVRLMEDSHEILNLADLWLETLYQVATEVAAKDPELAAELRATHAHLSTGWRDRAHEEHALAAVLGAADRLDRQLVLMVENLQALSGNQDEDFGWKLRQVLQTEPKIILLATATSRFKALHDAEHAFFELFRSIELQPLATEECRRLWQAASGVQVAGRRIRPLEILTGGSPRLIVMVAGFARHGSLNRLMEELATLIDEHSEYFRNHVEILPRTERRIYIAVIDLWRPSSSAEIAERARMDIRLVSASLGRLVDRGAVIAEGNGRKRLYHATERLYCIYYKLRRDRHEVALVHHLIEFMAGFYSESELTDLPGRLIAEASRSEDIREGLERALADMPEFASIFKEGTKRQVHRLKSCREDVEEHWQVLDAASKEGELAIVNEILAHFGESSAPRWQTLAAEALARKGELTVRLGQEQAALQACEAFDRRTGVLSARDRTELEWRTTRVRIQALAGQGRPKEALAWFLSAYSRFDPGHNLTVNWIVTCTRDLVAGGITARAILEVLSSDRQRSDALLPLVTALRQRIGEDVRVPSEVLEVSADIRDYLDQ